MGEDIGKLGGVFRVTDGLQARLRRPTASSTRRSPSPAIIGTAVGLAYRGYRPVCEIQFDGFIYPAFDQIVAQVAQAALAHPGRGDDADHHPRALRRRHRRGRAPLRVARGATSRTPPGCGSCTCSNPQDAYIDDPPGHRERRPGAVLRAEAPLLGEGRGRLDEPLGTRPMDSARVVAAGHRRDARRLRRRSCRRRSTRRSAAADDGISIEVIDLRSLSPLDFDTVEALGAQDRSARHRPRGGAQSAGLGAEIAAEHHRALLLAPRGRARAGHGLRHPVPAREARGALPARPRPHPRRRRPRARPRQLAERGGGG